jgi:hypothetical protein
VALCKTATKHKYQRDADGIFSSILSKLVRIIQKPFVELYFLHAAMHLRISCKTQSATDPSTSALAE